MGVEQFPPGARGANSKVTTGTTAPVGPIAGDIWLDTTAPAWTAPTLLNSWVDYGGTYDVSGYWKDPSGVVHLKGLIKLGTLSTIFNLPSGYRPSAERIFNAMAASGQLDLRITAAGAVNATAYFGAGSNGWVSLSGICFPAF